MKIPAWPRSNLHAGGESLTNIWRTSRDGYQQLSPHRVVLGLGLCDSPLPDMQLDKGKREVSFTESRCWMNTSARSTSSIDFTRWTFPRLILSNKLGLQQKGMGLVWRIYASNYELSQKLLEVPPGDFENRWEHIMREKRVERWRRSVGLDHSRVICGSHRSDGYEA